MDQKTDQELINSSSDKVVVKRMAINTSDLVKMRRIQSLFSEELPPDAKESEVLAFFYQKAFESFLKSGIIEQKIKEITG